MFKDLKPAKPNASAPAPIEANRLDVRAARQVVSDIGDAAITGRAEQIRYASDEEMVWQDRPSRVLIGLAAAKLGLVWLCLLVGVLFAQARLFPPPSPSPVVAAADGGDGGLAAGPRRRAPQPLGRILLADGALLIAAYMGVRFGVTAVRLLTTRYSATSQRLFVETGVLKSTSRPFELYQLTGDAIVSRSILLRPFNIGDVSIGPVTIMGVNNPDYVRDILRTGGQLEAQRADKIRWR